MTADEMVAQAYALLGRAHEIYAAEYERCLTIEHYHQLRAHSAATRADALTEAQITLSAHWELT